MNLIIISLPTLVFIGALSAIILFVVSNKFKVYEDPIFIKGLNDFVLVVKNTFVNAPWGYLENK